MFVNDCWDLYKFVDDNKFVMIKLYDYASRQSNEKINMKIKIINKMIWID